MKIFIYLGGDLGDDPVAFLERQKQLGYHLLPIDATAIGLAVQSGAPFSLLDDWVDAAAMERMRDKAAETGRDWYASSRDLFTVEGVLWPEMDRRAMTGFWRELALAEELARVFQERNVEEVCFCQHRELRPSFYFGRSDTWSELLRHLLGSKAKVLPIVESIPEPTMLARGIKHANDLARGGVKAMLAATKLPSFISRSEHRDARRIEGRTTLVFYIPEFFRLKPVAEQMQKYCKEKAAAVVFNANQEFVTKLEEEWGFPVLYSLKPYIISPWLRARFLKGYAHAKEQWFARHFSEQVVRSLDFQFEFYCRERWPMLVTWLQSWKKLWKRAKPEAVLVTSLDYTEAQLPAEAANQLGIPTASVPHAVVTIAKENTLSTRFMFYSLPLQRRFGDGALQIEEDQGIRCRDLITRQEYEPHKLDSATHSGQWRVLVLGDPCSTPGMLMPHAITYGIQFKALKILANPPSDIREHLSLLIKPHPGYPAEADLYREFGDKTWDVLPAKVSLFDQLGKCDLVVGMNYYGSAIVHVLAEDKPILFLQTHPKGVEAMAADAFRGAGEAVSTEEEFWNAIRNFFTCPEYADHIRSINRNFRKRYLEAHDFPDMKSAIGTLLERSGRGR